MRHFPSLPLLLLAMSASAADPMVFISAFATGEKAGIHSFRFNTEQGTLSPLHRTADIQNPFFLAIAPTGKHLYAIDTAKFGGPDHGYVAAYAIEGRNGELRRLNKASTRGTASCYLATDPSNHTVLVANYSSGDIAALPIKADGSLEEAASFIQHSGTGGDPKRQKSPNAHSIIVSPDNRFALAADLGIDKIMIYRFDAAKSSLTPNETQPFAKLAPASGPRHITFHPNGRLLYAINELANTLTVFDYNAEKGTLTEKQTLPTLPPNFEGKSYTADLKITPDGKHLYGTNRGHDSIASYKIAPDGTLTLLNIEPSLGKGPQNLLITPDGRWLLCANMPSNNVAVFSIDAATGALKAQNEPVAIPSPSCIRWLD